jgi:hypothetical protein
MLSFNEMENNDLWLVVGAALGLALLVGQLHSWYRLSHIKGPFGTGFSNLWLWKHQLGGRLCEDLEEVCNKYGMFKVEPQHGVDMGDQLC